MSSYAFCQCGAYRTSMEAENISGAPGDKHHRRVPTFYGKCKHLLREIFRDHIKDDYPIEWKIINTLKCEPLFEKKTSLYIGSETPSIKR